MLFIEITFPIIVVVKFSKFYYLYSKQLKWIHMFSNENYKRKSFKMTIICVIICE